MERTFAIIKPDAVAANQTGEILADVQKAGFKVVGLKMKRLSQIEAENFYGVHRERPFFGSLVTFMTEGPAVVMVLERLPEWRARSMRDPAALESRRLAIIGGVSLLCWSVAIASGRMIGYW